MHIDERTFQTVRETLCKEAAGAMEAVRPLLRNMGSLGGAGMAAGALGGAALGASHGFSKARREGAGIGGSLGGALGGAVRGAVPGVLLGGLGGQMAGAAATHFGADVSGLAQRSGVLGAGSRFGQRQVHALTGMLSPAELEGVRGGAFNARAALKRATTDAVTKANKSGVVNAEPVIRAGKALKTTEAATGVGPGSMNLTSLPGYVGAVKEHGVGKVLSTSLKEQLANQPRAMTALMLGAPTLAAGKALAGSEEFNAKGQGRGERAGEAIGGALGGIAGGVMPLGGQLAAGGALGSAGKMVGRGIDRLRGRRPTPGLSQPGMSARTLEPTESQNAPSERIMSPNAAGQKPDIGL